MKKNQVEVRWQQLLAVDETGARRTTDNLHLNLLVYDHTSSHEGGLGLHEKNLCWGRGSRR